MILHGICHFGNKRVACRNDYCTVCEAPTFAEGRRSLVMLHVFFVPLIPLGLKVRWFCTACRQETDVKRPSRTGMLIAGILFGFFMMFVGVMTLILNQEPKGWAVIGMGLVTAGALIWLKQRQDYHAYEIAKRDIVPLSTDFCPYCRDPLLAGTTPRCYSCDVKIVTK